MNSRTTGGARMMVLAGISLALSALALALPSSAVVAGGKKDESQVKFSASATKPDKDGRQKVTITIHPIGSAVQRLYGLVPWKGDLEEFDRWLNDPDEGAWGPRDA